MGRIGTRMVQLPDLAPYHVISEPIVHPQFMELQATLNFCSRPTNLSFTETRYSDGWLGAQ